MVLIKTIEKRKRKITVRLSIKHKIDIKKYVGT